MTWVHGAVLVTLGWLPAAHAWAAGMDSQRIVARRCVAALPSLLAPFYQDHLADLEERVIEPEGVWRRDRRMRARLHWDHLWMDVRAEDGSVSARLAAGETFPRAEREARELFESAGVGVRGGRLPWAMAELHADLVRAFEQRDAQEVIRSSGHLAALACAASQPFSVTMNHDGRQTGNLYLGELSMGDPYYPHQSAHQRIFGELVRRYRNRYLEHVQVRPIELRPIPDPLDPCFQHLLGSLARVDDLLTADRQISRQLGLVDGASLIKREDEFYELLDGRCGDLVVERLRAGALLSANLIAGAWEQAGRPVLETSPAAGPEAVPDQPDDDATDASGAEPADPTESSGYIGSRSSTVFHRPECAHVVRISPSNLVRYPTAQDAQRQGKRPCRVCKPE